MQSLYVVLLVVLTREGFAQTGLVSRGPFVVSENASSVYGKNNRLFVLSDGGVWYTDDRIEWKKSTYSFYFVNSFTKDRDGNLYACSDVSIYKSTDNGETWSGMLFSLNDGVTGDPPEKNSFLKYSISRDTLFVGSSKGIGYVVGDNFFGALLHQFVDHRAFAIAVDHNLVVALTDGGIKVSVDRGASSLPLET